MVQIGPYELALIVAACAFGSALIFSRRGRNPYAGFLFGLILGPIGVAIALVLSPVPRGTNQLES